MTDRDAFGFDKNIWEKSLLLTMGHRQTDVVGFHVPGHASGRFFTSDYAHQLLLSDTTELSVTDDLHAPHGPVKAVAEKFSDAYQCAYTLLVTTGTTSAVMTMLTAISRRMTFVLVPRAVHQSVIYALSFLRLPFAHIDVDASRQDAYGLYPPPNEADIKRAFESHPEATDVVLTSPDYYGQIMELEPIIAMCHRHNCRVLVDEAHGAHLRFLDSGHKRIDAMAAGADMCVQSVHKTLPALTMASCLHVSQAALRDRGLCVADLRAAFDVCTTTSPSYMIAASAECALDWVRRFGHTASSKMLFCLKSFCDRLNAAWPELRVRRPGVDKADPMRLVINTRYARILATSIASHLASEHIAIEFCDLFRLVLVVSFWQNQDDFDALFSSLMRYKATCKPLSLGRLGQLDEIDKLWSINASLARPIDRVILPRYDGRVRRRLSACKNKRAAQAIVAYPPGIAIVWPGEKITQADIFLLDGLMSQAFTLRGISDNSVWICTRGLNRG